MGSMRSPLFKASMLLGYFALLSGCQPNSPGINPISINLAPNIGSLYQIRGLISSGGSCNSPDPVPASPDPVAWWASMSPLSKQGKVAVGYQYWSNTNPGCDSARQDNYRGVATYDLANLKAASTATTPIQSLIIGAKIQLTIQAGTPASVPIGSCLPNFAGVGAIEQLRSGYTILTGLTRVTGGTALAFPAGANATSVAGLAVPGTSGRLSTSVGGGGMTVVDIDVKDLLIGALNRGDPDFGIMIDGSTETLQQSSSDPQVDCRTLVSVGQLEVKHL